MIKHATSSDEAPVPEVLSDMSAKRHHEKAQKIRRHYVKGPLPMAWFEQAAKLPGKALAVALLLWFRQGMMRDDPIKVSMPLIARFRVGRKAASRALTALEEAGLVEVNRKSGRLSRVRIVGYGCSKMKLPDSAVEDEM